MIETNNAHEAQDTRARASQVAALRDAVQALEGSGATELVGPNFVACVALLLREHLRPTVHRRISAAALLLAQQVNEQRKAHRCRYS